MAIIFFLSFEELLSYFENFFFTFHEVALILWYTDGVISVPPDAKSFFFLISGILGTKKNNRDMSTVLKFLQN